MEDVTPGFIGVGAAFATGQVQTSLGETAQGVVEGAYGLVVGQFEKDGGLGVLAFGEVCGSFLDSVEAGEVGSLQVSRPAFRMSRL